jgi:putative DNA primase/helicase
MNSYERIPEELQQLRQWHVWRQTEETKIPLQINGSAAKSNDPNTWTDFATAAEASQFFSGLAFEISEPYCGIDLDNCFDENGKLRSWAWPILSRFDGCGYAEISPSGRGIKILTRARKPAIAKCVHKFGDEKQQIECYDKTRFWAITGDVYSGNDQIQDGQTAVDWLCNQYLSGAVEEKTGTIKHDPAPPRTNFSTLMDRAIKYCEKIPSESKGNLRNAAFKTSGHLHSLVDEFGMRLTDD